MSNLQVFKNDLFQVSVKLENGQTVFDAETVAKSLGITTVAKSGNVCVRWSRVNEYLGNFRPEMGEIKNGDFIPESAVYKLAFKASNEVAEKFQDWLAVEVLPSIRKHGAYMTDNTIEKALTDPDFLIRLATNLKDEKQKRIAAENKIQTLTPKAEFYDNVAGSKDAIEMGHVAKVLNIKGYGRNNLFDFLRSKKVLDKSNIPYQKFVDAGYFRVLEQKYNVPNGETKINIKTLVFQKGVDHIIKLIKEEGGYINVE